jgi:hypothetical protein
MTPLPLPCIAGFVTLRFYSGEGQGFLGCMPNQLVRTVLRATVLAELRPKDTTPFPQLAKVPVREWLKTFLVDADLKLEFY